MALGVKTGQLPNASAPISVTVLGKVTFVKVLLLKKAAAPIAVTGSPLYCSGMMTEVSV